MEMEAAFIIAAFLVETLATVAGFGTSVLLLPVALVFFDFRAALAIVALFHIMSGIVRVAVFRKWIDWKLFAAIAPFAVAGAVVGALLAAVIPQQPAQLVFGVLLSLFAAYSLLKGQLCFGNGKGVCRAAGGACGFLAGSVGVGGAPLSAFMSGMGLKNGVYVGTAAAVMLAINFARAPVYFAVGFFPNIGAAEMGLLLLAALSGALFGRRLSSMLPKETVRKIVLGALFVAGILIAL